MTTLLQLFMDEIHANGETKSDIIGWAYDKDGNVRVQTWIDAINYDIDEGNRYVWAPDVAMWSTNYTYITNNFEDGDFEILIIPNFHSNNNFDDWIINEPPSLLKNKS